VKLDPDGVINGRMLTDPVSGDNDEEEEREDERMLPVTMATGSAAKTATTDAPLHYAIDMTSSTRPRHRDPTVVEIDLLEQGSSF